MLELKRPEEWVNLFEPQAVVRCAVRTQAEPLKFRGRDELMALARKVMFGEFDIVVGAGLRQKCRHLLSNVALFGSESARVASGYADVIAVTVAGPDPPRWLAAGRYSDELVKSPSGDWQYAGRTYVPD